MAQRLLQRSSPRHCSQVKGVGLTNSTAALGSAMPVRPAVPTAAASQIDRCSQVVPGAATCQGDLLQMGHQDQSSSEMYAGCPACLHGDSYRLQVGLELHPQQ